MHMRMNGRTGSATRGTGRRRQRPTAKVLRMELVRKGIHLLVVLVPTMAKMHRGATIAILAAGIAAYALFETLRRAGLEVPIVSRLTAISSRERDEGKFVLGPVTLGTGALLSVLLFPPQAADIAIYALGFGDGLSSLAGRYLGRMELPFTGGKSLEGSLTCFAAVLIASTAVSGDALRSIPIAMVATIVEAIPARDYDNIALPLATGLAALTMF